MEERVNAHGRDDDRSDPERARISEISWTLGRLPHFVRAPVDESSSALGNYLQ
jgi:hypothetical protein